MQMATQPIDVQLEELHASFGTMMEHIMEIRKIMGRAQTLNLQAIQSIFQQMRDTVAKTNDTLDSIYTSMKMIHNIQVRETPSREPAESRRRIAQRELAPTEFGEPRPPEHARQIEIYRAMRAASVRAGKHRKGQESKYPGVLNCTTIDDWNQIMEFSKESLVVVGVTQADCDPSLRMKEVLDKYEAKNDQTVVVTVDTQSIDLMTIIERDVGVIKLLPQVIFYNNGIGERRDLDQLV